jgi:uncharacterized protein
MMRQRGRARSLALVALAVVLLTPLVSRPLCAFPFGGDRSWVDTAGTDEAEEMRRAKLPYRRSTQSSRYLTMRDGVRIAVDIYLPEGIEPGKRIPAIVMQTRYIRSLHGRWPFKRLVKGRFFRLVTAFVRRGYAWVYADARGSGASFGTRSHPYGADEIADAGELIDWVVSQPWSDGQVGAWGSSYTGGSALRIAATGHPALKAIMPRFAMFDMYADAVFPGGLHLRWLTDAWSTLAGALDDNRIHKFVGLRAKVATKGIAPVDGDTKKKLLALAVADHAANGDVADLVKGITYRDDSPKDRPGETLDQLSPHGHLQGLKEADVAMYFVSGWMDAAFIRSQTNLYMNLKGPKTKLTIGPWDHGGYQNVSPIVVRRRPRFDHIAEALRFFDKHLKGVETGIHAEAPVHYFTMVEEAWKTAPTWPPPGATPTRFYFSERGGLTSSAPSGTDGGDDYRVDMKVGSGSRSRWNSLINLRHRAIRYWDRAVQDKRLLVYETKPLGASQEVTGHPLARIWLSSDAEDGAIFVYLEDVAPDGRVTYVTEGLLRALHRRVSPEAAPYETPTPAHSFKRHDGRPLTPGQPTELLIELYPTSYLFKARHRIRVAIAGADKDHFAPVNQEAPRLRIHRSRDRASSIELPLMTSRPTRPEETP